MGKRMFVLVALLALPVYVAVAQDTLAVLQASSQHLGVANPSMTTLNRNIQRLKLAVNAMAHGWKRMSGKLVDPLARIP